MSLEKQVEKREKKRKRKDSKSKKFKKLNKERVTKHHSYSTSAGVESDSNPTAAAPGQTEITDLNCSDHSTTSKEMAA